MCRLQTALLIYVLLLSACLQNEPAKSTRFNPLQIEQEARQMLMAYHDAIEEEGLTAEFRYLDDSPQFFWVPPGYRSALSYDSVKVIVSANAELFRSTVFKWATLEIFPLSDALCTYTGIVEGSMIDTTDKSSTVSIIESGTLIKRKDGWKLLCGQSAVLGE